MNNKWKFYLFGTLFYDLPFLAFGVLMILAMQYTIFPPIERIALAEAWKWQAAFCSIFVATPVLFSLALRVPILLSPVLLILFSIWIIA